ncbi:hypothetical protein QBC38DRAFT_508242 [Podospora fimiseda]|uniref:Copper-fist domain-containing protein n=1 Tax=Podospora fimiseda TaxID=252190 RepID=A0AAN7H6B9_9PEZI|nr:hypothetical protein QBC38DRAFT_508242 [Podospora fimiseda]
MPMINGQKMACAPCIRGHRSTKCNHYYERVMIPVRKPGRPLSTCPCPPGRPCQCGGVRVAIPKKQKCSCPAGAADGSEDNEHEVSPTETSTSTSPTRSTFRVSKSGSGSKAGSRKQSFDPAHFERMDPRQFNIIPSPNGSILGGMNGIAIASSPGDVPGITGFAPPMGMMPVGPGPTFVSTPGAEFAAIAYNMSPPTSYMSQIQIPQHIKAENGGYISTPNGHYVSSVPAQPFMNGNHANGIHFNPPPPQPEPILESSALPKANGMASRGGSCCSTKATPPAPAPVAMPPAQPIQSMPPPPPQQKLPVQPDSAVRSCCSGKTEGPPQHPPQHISMPPPQQGFGQAFDMQQFSSPADVKVSELDPFQHQMHAGPQMHQTVFTYPPDIGSWQHPISPAIYQQVISRQSVPAPVQTPISPATNGNNGSNSNHAGGDNGNSHECSCGPGCLCEGCLAHPFNPTMFQYVSGAYSSSVDGSANGSANGSPSVGPVGSNHNDGHHTPRPINGTGSESPPEGLTPITEGSPALLGAGEQSLAESDFFFFEMPISGLCGGSIQSCPCGDDCECLGCSVHGPSAAAAAGSGPTHQQQQDQ